MINFNLYALMLAWVLIRHEYSLAAKEAAAAPEGARLSAKDQERLRGNVHHGIGRPLRGLYIADDRLATITNLVELRGPYAELAHELKALGSDLLAATQYERFYHYPRDKGLLVIRVPGDWAAALKAFPSAEEDIKAAVDCYALEHHNASIYHCMMVLERGLPALAKRIGAKFSKDRPTWKDMIDDIRKRVDARRLALHSPPRGSKPIAKTAANKERALLEAAGEAALEFKFFEHAWRNHIAHGRAEYDENDAKKVLDHTRSFMEVIATKLKLKERK